MITTFAVLVLFLYLGKTPKSWWLSAQWKSELRRSYENTEESIDKNCGGIYVTVIRKRGASPQSVTTADQHFLAYSAEGVLKGKMIENKIILLTRSFLDTRKARLYMAKVTLRR